MSVYRQGRTAANTCPRCQEVLVEARPGARYCEKCGGVFADLPTSHRILETLDRQLLAIGFDAAQGRAKPRDDGRALTCPECQMQMIKNRIESANCEVDACPMHGTWFDTGELVDVIRAFERQRRKGIVLTRSEPSVAVSLTPDEPPPPEARDMKPDLVKWLSELLE